MHLGDNISAFFPNVIYAAFLIVFSGKRSGLYKKDNPDWVPSVGTSHLKCGGTRKMLMEEPAETDDPNTREQGTVSTVGLHISEEIEFKTKCLRCITTQQSLRAKLQLLIPNTDVNISI